MLLRYTILTGIHVKGRWKQGYGQAVVFDSGQMTPSHQISCTRGYSSSMHHITRLPLSSRDTHVTPVVPARKGICIGVAHAIADLNPIPGAVGELGDNSWVKPGRVPALEAQHTASIQRAINTTFCTALLHRVHVQARTGRGGRGGRRKKERGINGHSGIVSRQSARGKPRDRLLPLLLLPPLLCDDTFEV